jgi:hypothetical protein
MRTHATSLYLEVLVLMVFRLFCAQISPLSTCPYSPRTVFPLGSEIRIRARTVWQVRRTDALTPLLFLLPKSKQEPARLIQIISFWKIITVFWQLLCVLNRNDNVFPFLQYYWMSVWYLCEMLWYPKSYFLHSERHDMRSLHACHVNNNLELNTANKT